MAVGGLDPTVGDRTRPLYVDGNVLYGSQGLNIVVSHDGGETYEPFGNCEGFWGEHQMSQWRLSERLGRLGVHALRPLSSSGTVAVLRKRIVWCAPSRQQFQEVLHLNRGSRPLGICATSAGWVYFGEYFNNPKRQPVHVYGSPDGKNWSVVHTFPTGSIRHVHNIVEDQYRNGIWVLTGDSNEESGLWFTDDNFQTLDCVVKGTQRARAVALIPLEEGLIVPTDTPHVQNYVQHCNPETGALTQLAQLPNSAFHAVKQGGLHFISTVAEPSTCNDTKFATVFVSRDATTWHQLATFPRDWETIRQRHRFVNRAIRHPEVHLVPGHNKTGFIFGYGRGIRGADGQSLRWSCDQVFSHVRALEQDA